MRGVLYGLSSILSLCQSICNHEIFVKLNLSIFPVLVGRRENHKDASILAAKQTLIPSNPSSTLDAMNFQKLQLFSGSPDRYVINGIHIKIKGGEFCKSDFQTGVDNPR